MGRACQEVHMGWNIQLPAAEYYTPEDPRLQEIVNEVVAIPEVAIDTETDGLILWKCVPHYWSLSWQNGHDRRICMPASTLPFFQDAWKSTEKKWVFANAKFDVHMLSNVGVNIQGHLVDSQVMDSLMYEEESHGLKPMAKRILGWKWTDFQDTFGSLRKGTCVCGHIQSAHKKETGTPTYCKKCSCSQFKQANPLDQLRKAEKENMELLVEYASNDAYGTWKVYQELKKRMEAEPTWSAYENSYPFIQTMADLFYKVEMPFTKVLYTCERNGMRLDRERLEGLRPGIDAQVAELSRNITALAGYRMNPNSNDDLRKYFFDEQGCEALKLTSGGKSGIKNKSVDVNFLKFIAGDSTPSDARQMAKYIERLRKLTKQKSTYIDGMLDKLDRQDRVHARFNQDVARTGRLSSSDPNLQNITGGAKDEFKLRNAFIPEKGNTMIVADYEQLEMRLLGCASQEEKIIEIFLSGRDIHTGNCELVYGIDYDSIQKARKIEKQVKQGNLPESAMTDEVRRAVEARQAIKTIGFGLNYGMKEKKLSRDLGITKDEALELIERYMGTYPAVKQFYAEAIEEARQTGYAFTYLGRRRALPAISSRATMDRWGAERQAVNLPIQGTAADAAKMAMILIHEDKLDEKYGCHMLSQVHDELIFECPKETAEEVMPIIKDWMEHPFPTDMAVPLTIDIGQGPSWGAAK